MHNVVKPLFQQSDFPQSKLIDVNGIQLEVFETGVENRGKPIVLCHGFPEHAYSWRYQIPALAAAGYHVIVPNQRGYGNSSCPEDVSAYDIKHLTADLIALLDYYGYEQATFAGHDWGANVVWHLALLHPQRVHKVINLALPYQERGEKPWIEFMEEEFGEDFYFVHFNKKPGVADAILKNNSERFLKNLYRKNIPLLPPDPGMYMINLAMANEPKGDPLMQDEDLEVYIAAFNKTGFVGAINWYRNLDRNWHLMADIKPHIIQPVLMIYGTKDAIPESPTLKDFAPNLDVARINCGHCIQQEAPEQTNDVIIQWLRQKDE
jgi:pimeloyl-ACP methyl ester carboxylesterase